jgi:hypothetical protein
LQAACLLAALSSALGAEPLLVAPGLWDRPRSARAVLDQPEIREAVRTYLAQAGSRIVIHHGLGQEPLLQAEELRTWLMALAVDAARITLVNDLKSNQTMTIEVLK